MNKRGKKIDEKLKIIDKKIDPLNESTSTVHKDISTLIEQSQRQYQHLEERIKEAVRKIEPLESSADHIFKCFKDQREDIKDIKLKQKNLEKENKHLNSELHMMKEQLETTKQQLNANAQYMRSSWILEISGIPTLKDEDTKDIVYKLASLAKMQDFSKDQVDVAHRTSSKSTAPIIVLFYKKSDRNHFYEQKYNFETIRSNQFSDDNAAEEEQHLESNDIEHTQRIDINENLAKENRELKLAREEAKKLKYKYKGYTVKGEV